MVHDHDQAGPDTGKTSRLDEATGTHTVGHEWDGIEELDTPLPRWWLILFYLCIVFAIVYVILYPALPGLRGATPGVLGWTSRGALAADIKTADAGHAAVRAAIAAMPVEDLVKNPVLQRAAIEGGRAAFKQNCVQCHGAGAAGSKGYPNLNDDDWLWGGTLTDIQTTLTHGIRFPGDEQTRTSLMPSFGATGILTAPQVSDVASYVRSFSGLEPKSDATTRGAAIFAANCVACHGPEGKGGRAVGAPNLTDKIWLYGSDKAQVEGSITNAHAGVMPAWGGRLDPVTIKMLAAYVHSLGGGEAFAAQPGATPTPASAGATNGQP